MKKALLLFALSLLCIYSFGQPYILAPTTTGGTKGAGGILQYNLGTNTFENITSINSLNPKLDLDGLEFFGITQGDNDIIYVTTFSGGDYGEGTLFSYDLNTGNVAMLYSFGIDGEFGIPLPNNPRFKPLYHNNALYGVTGDGGDYGWGAVYKYDLITEEMTFLVHFNNEHLQSSPLIVGENENILYGTSSSGNGHGEAGTIYGIDLTSNSIFRVYNFYDEYIGGMNKPWGPIVMHGDEIYGTTKKNDFRGFSGGIYAYNVVKKELRVVLKILETDVEGTTYQGITKTSFNQLYATALGGGARNGGVLQYIQPSAHNSEIKYVFPYDGWMESVPVSLNGVLYGIRDYKEVQSNSGWSVIYKLEDASSDNPNYSELYTIDVNSINAYDYIITNDGLLIGGYSTVELNGSGGLFSFDVNTGNFKKLIEFKTNGGNTLAGQITKINDKKYYVSAQTGAKSDQGAILKYEPSTDDFTKIQDVHYAYSLFNNGLISHSNYPSTRHYINSEGKFIFSADMYNRGIISLWSERPKETYEYYRGVFAAIDTANDHKISGLSQMRYEHDLFDSQGNYQDRFGFYTNISLLDIDGDTALVFIDNRIGKVNTKTFERFDTDTLISDVDTHGENFGDHMIFAQNNLVYGMMRKKGANGLGTLFSYNYQTKAFTNLHQFDSLTGSSPSSGLFEASDGHLYGMTSLGGNFNKGVLFKYDISNQQLSVLKHFNGNTDGGHPKGSLTEENGILYGVTFDGGSHNLGTLFKYTLSSSSFEVLLNLDKTTGGHPLNTTPFIDCVVPGITSLELDPTSINCTGDALTFKFKTIRGSSNQWDLPTNTSIISQSDTSMTLDISNLNVGRYTLGLSSTNTCGSSTPVITGFEKTQTVNIDNIKTQQSITCKIAFASFEMDGVQLADSYRWKIPNGAIVIGDDNKQRIQLSLQGIGFGDHAVVGYVENNCGAIDSAEYQFTIDTYTPIEINYTFTPYSETGNHQIASNIYCTDKISGVITYDNRPANISQIMWDFPHKDSRIKDLSHGQQSYYYPWHDGNKVLDVYNQNNIELTLPLIEGPNQIRVWGYAACGGTSLINTDTIFYYTPYQMTGIKTTNNNICVGQVIDLEAEYSGGYGFDFEWILPSSASIVSHDKTNKPSIVFNEAGTFKVGVTTLVPSTGCNLTADTSYVDVTIDGIKTILLTGTDAVCGNSNENIKVFIKDHDGTPITWDYPNEAIKLSSSTNDTLLLDVSMLSEGDYQISAKGVGNCFDLTPTTFNFNVHDGDVIVDRLESSHSSSCYSTEYTVSAIGTQFASSHEWIFSENLQVEGPTNTALLSFSFADETFGEEVIKYVAKNGCHISDTLTQTITVGNKPIIEGIELPDEICQTTHDTLRVSIIQNATSVKWNLPEGAIVVDSIDVETLVVNFTNVAENIHQINVQATNGCGDSNVQTASIQVSSCVVTSINNLEAEITLFPNPSADFINLKGLKQLSNLEYAIVDVAGRVIDVQKALTKHQIDISELKTGNYFIQLSEGNDIVFRKAFVKK